MAPTAPDWPTVAPERVAQLAAMSYEDYLRTPEWQAKADAAKRRAGHRCQVCNRPGVLNAHHRTYERRGDEEPGDLVVLCGDGQGEDGCHGLFHHVGRLRAGSRLPADPLAVPPLRGQMLEKGWRLFPPPAGLETRQARLARARWARRAAREARGPGRMIVSVGIGLLLLGFSVLAAVLAFHAAGL
jgi:hypothetical protein